jgi:hypothetical protein
VGAWRLTGVCRASRERAKGWLRTLPGLVVCGGLRRGGEVTSAAWRLDLGELRWERMPDLALARVSPACCAVRGGLVVLGGLGGQHLEHKPGENELEDCFTASLEVLAYDSEAEQILKQISLPPLSCGPLRGAAAVTIDESESEQGQVLLIGGDDGRDYRQDVHKVDLATGVCTPLPSALLSARLSCTAVRLPDGRVVCVGKNDDDVEGIAAEILEELPDQGSLTNAASWQWRELPGMSVARCDCGGCVLSDGRFAAFGGETDHDGAEGTFTTSCEVLTLDGDDERWGPLRPMHTARLGFACAAVGGCVIVAGSDMAAGDMGDGMGDGRGTVEVYEEALRRWRRLPCSLPDDAGVFMMGVALV